MPWPGRAHRVLDDAELGGVGPQRVDLLARDRVRDRAVDVGGGDVVVLGRQGEVGATHRAPGQAQAVEGLRGGDLVDQVQVDVEQVGLAVGGPHDVAVPDLLGECRGGGVAHLVLRPGWHDLSIWDTVPD